MAKKPAPAELKKQGEEISKSFAEIRKKQHNFAMQIGKEGLVFVIDRKKPADVLWRNAKKDGGGPKGTQGRVNMNGKILELDSDDPDSVPKNLMKLAKKHFAERGQSVRVVLKGVEEEADEDAVEEQEAGAARSRQEEEAPAAEEAAAPAQEEEAETASGGGGGGQEEAAASGDAPAEEQEAEAGGAGGDDALRETLQKEFAELESDLEAAEKSDNKGVVKKIGGLKGMFETQIEADVKRAGSVLSLLKSTLTTAIDAGHIVREADGAAAEQAMAERRSKLEELEKGVDALLAEFAA